MKSDFYFHDACNGIIKNELFQGITAELIGPIRFDKKGKAAGEFLPNTRTLYHNRDQFISQLSNDDIHRLQSISPKVFFSFKVIVPGTKTAEHHEKNILFAYKILDENIVYWTLKSTKEFEIEINKRINKSNTLNSIKNFLIFFISFPLSLFFCKKLFKDDVNKSIKLPTVEKLDKFIKESQA